MYRHDPAGQVAIRDLAKACVEEHLFQSFLVREVPNGGREIFIDAGRVVRHFRANPGKKPERVPIIQYPQPTKDGSGKLQAHKPPAWLQNTVNFRDRLPKITDVPHAKPCGHGMEGPIGESQIVLDFRAAGGLATDRPALDDHGLEFAIAERRQEATL